MESKHHTEHFVAAPETIPLPPTSFAKAETVPRSLWIDVWRKLCGRPMFIISSFMVLFVIIVAVFPALFTDVSPNEGCLLAHSDGAPTAGHPMGFTFQGCDVYSRVVHGTRVSLVVGLLSLLGVLVVGVPIGALAGHHGGWIDAALSRLGDVFFALPLLLGALVITQLPIFRASRSVWTVVLVIIVLAWPQTARVTRGSVITVKNADFITAARSVGASESRILVRHVLPNAIAPVLVLAPLELAAFIVAEATLSFLGVGVPESVVSWGYDMAAAMLSIRTNIMVLIYPAIALSITLLSFFMLGEALREALDPKSRR